MLRFKSHVQVHEFACVIQHRFIWSVVRVLATIKTTSEWQKIVGHKLKYIYIRIQWGKLLCAVQMCSSISTYLTKLSLSFKWCKEWYETSIDCRQLVLNADCVSRDRWRKYTRICTEKLIYLWLEWTVNTHVRINRRSMHLCCGYLLAAVNSIWRNRMTLKSDRRNSNTHYTMYACAAASAKCEKHNVFRFCRLRSRNCKLHTNKTRLRHAS